MTTVLHVIDRLTGGGPTRTLTALGATRHELGLVWHHRAVTLRREAYPWALIQAKRAGLEVMRAPELETLIREMSEADLVVLHFWNNPDLYHFLRRDWPPCRLILWVHIGGENEPQVLTGRVLSRAAGCVVTSPATLQLPPLREPGWQPRVRFIPGMNDFSRVEGARLRPHSGFNVGYIGTVNFSKMHSDYLALHAEIDVPDLRLVVCGSGGGESILKRQAAELGMASKLDLRGFVENIKPVLETLDVFGYPLCPDTYATSEKSLQEAMWVGVPPVVFPHGGIPSLVEDGETGLVVRSKSEYRAAIEFLYHHPQERQRLGRNARAYVQKHFDPKNAGPELDSLVRQLLKHPKRNRPWRGLGADASPSERFIESLGDRASAFKASREGPNREAEHQIAAASPLLAQGEGGIVHYRNTYPEDPFLRFWAGLLLLHQGRTGQGREELQAAVERGLDPARVEHYLHSRVEEGEGEDV